ncbi:ABC transporter substrate-binding protein [Saccharothrix deserti]|uniref:ABC transporter substrate-binding protein n=1 Tax=Saccharothrix deserti TaxID=2593674 RepID=UPI0030845177
MESDAILVPGDSTSTSVKDLKGRNIAVAKGSSAHGQILVTLAAEGLTTKDVTLTQKRVDAWAVWDPYTSQAEQEAGARVLTDGRGKANGYTFQVASREALDSPGRSEAIKEFVKRYSQAQRWADTHHEEWAQAWAAETGLKIEVARAAVARGVDLSVKLGDEVIESEQELADAFTADGTLPGKVDFRKFVDTRFAGELS